MKRISPALCLLLAFLPGPQIHSLGQTAASREITVAFWNVQWFPGRRPNARPADEQRQIHAVQADIGRLHADIIGLEEVRDFHYAGVAVATLSGFKVDVCSTFPPREGQKIPQQVSLVSRRPAMSAWAEAWQDHGALTPPRGFAFAAYEIAPRRLLLVYAIHLKSNRGGLRENMVVREESMRQLRAHLEAMQRVYQKQGVLSWIVGGDFNTAPENPRFKLEKTTTFLTNAGFSWVWKKIPLSARVTLPPNRIYPAACFDQIYYKGLRLKNAEVIKTSHASSDHRAIGATFELPVIPSAVEDDAR